VVEGAEAVVDSGIEVRVPVYAEPGEGNVGCGDAELGVVSLNREVGGESCTSLLPRPKPLITGPRSLSGKGGCGVSGPAMGSRGPVGRTMVLMYGLRLLVQV
jgi:hypothetical protein